MIGETTWGYKRERKRIKFIKKALGAWGNTYTPSWFKLSPQPSRGWLLESTWPQRLLANRLNSHSRVCKGPDLVGLPWALEWRSWEWCRDLWYSCWRQNEEEESFALWKPVPDFTLPLLYAQEKVHSNLSYNVCAIHVETFKSVKYK